MKKVILTVALFLAGVLAFAGEVPASISTKIKSGISFPSHLKESNQAGSVRVAFYIDEQGKAVIVDMNTGDTALRNHVQNTLCMMVFDQGSFEPGKVMNMSISFQIH